MKGTCTPRRQSVCARCGRPKEWGVWCSDCREVAHLAAVAHTRRIYQHHARMVVDGDARNARPPRRSRGASSEPGVVPVRSIQRKAHS